MERIPAGTVRNQIAALLDRVAKGERIVITRGGKDAAMLGPVPQEPRRERAPAGPPQRYDPAKVGDVLTRAFPQKSRKERS